MFGILGNIVDGMENTEREFVADPVGKSVEMATQPVRDGLEVIDGFTEGELRYVAATRLGVDVASGMALSELLEWYDE